MAGSRHRLDLRVYAVHHEGERLHEALATAWSRSQARHLAVVLAAPQRRAAAVAEAPTQLASLLGADPARERLRSREDGRGLGIEL